MGSPPDGAGCGTRGPGVRGGTDGGGTGMADGVLPGVGKSLRAL